MAARKSVAVGDVVPLNRENISRDLSFVVKNIKHGLEAVNRDSAAESLPFFQQALQYAEGKVKNLTLNCLLS